MKIVPKFLEKAKNIAHKSISHAYKVGCVIANGSYIIGCGRNRPINHDERLPGVRSIHGEADALSKLRAPLAGAIAYVVVLTPNGHPAFSQPCAHCRAALRAAGVTTVVFSNRGKMEIIKI